MTFHSLLSIGHSTNGKDYPAFAVVHLSFPSFTADFRIQPLLVVVSDGGPETSQKCLSRVEIPLREQRMANKLKWGSNAIPLILWIKSSAVCNESTETINCNRVFLLSCYKTAENWFYDENMCMIFDWMLWLLSSLSEVESSEVRFISIVQYHIQSQWTLEV